MLKREDVDREGLLAALETEMPHIENFLDLRTGEVLTVVAAGEGEMPATGELDEIAADNRRLAARVRTEPERYERVPSIAPDAAFRWMQEFASTISDDSLRAEMHTALRDCADDCFERFRRCLKHAPDAERERWFAFRNEKLEEFVDTWLEGITPADA